MKWRGAHRGAVVRVLPPLYAHRLGRAYGHDSSAAALRGALAAGVVGLETDVCMTADRALVLLHDPYLPLGTNLEGFAHERTARELRRARLRDREGGLTAEAPLFVEDLLAAAPRDVVLQLEVKAHADPALAGRTVDPLAERLRGRTRGQRVEVLSFTAAAVAACARAAGLGCTARLVVWADYAPVALGAPGPAGTESARCASDHFLVTAPLIDTLRRAGVARDSEGFHEQPAAGRGRPPRARRRPSGFSTRCRIRIPLKMTSSIFSPHQVALCSPRTQAIASDTLLFPQPFGPTMAVTPPSFTAISARSENDLNPMISMRRSFNTYSSPHRHCWFLSDS